MHPGADGGHGTIYPEVYLLEEAELRGWTRLASSLRGNNDVLALTRPILSGNCTVPYPRGGAGILGESEHLHDEGSIAMADDGMESW